MRLQSLFALAPMVLAIAVTAQAPGPAPRFDAWKIVGPGGGGTMIAPTISPSDPGVVVEHCDMTGGYITLDGGLSWRMFNLRAGIETFAFDPSNPKRIYAGNAALWRSDDTGRTWRMLFPNPAKKTVEHRQWRPREYSLTSEDGNYVSGLVVRQIVVDPRDSNLVHIAFSDPQNGGTTVVFSKDGGVSFREEHEFPGDRILLLAYPGGERLAIGKQGVYRGRAEEPKPIAGPGDEIAHASLGVAQGTAIVYATTKKGNMFASEDGAKPGKQECRRLVSNPANLGQWPRHPQRPNRIYRLPCSQAGRSPRGYLQRHCKDDGLRGKSWSIMFRESTQGGVPISHGSWIDQRADGIGWDGGKSIIFDAPYSLAVAPGNPDICFASDLFRNLPDA